MLNTADPAGMRKRQEGFPIQYRLIHLLYVPTMNCNMACRYCYLEENTVEDHADMDAAQTLERTVKKLWEAGYIPFNISLHGGEVTTLPAEEFRRLIAYIARYYEDNRILLQSHGFTVGTPHIKTNLYNLGPHLDTIRDYHVSVSGSLDLPLSLHRTYRVGKGGQDTLDRIMENISNLTQIDCKKKVSATIFREHAAHTDEIISDIWRLHRQTCLDMNDFNFMIGFEYNSLGLLHALSQEEQVEFFHRIRDAFEGTELEGGLRGAWFKEFGPEYCTNCENCGTKFFLLERSGDMYSCVRGQKDPDFYYGNILREDVQDIMDRAFDKIETVKEETEEDPECASCGCKYLCRGGCPFVRHIYHSGKSYTCLLQKELYPFWGMEPEERPDLERLIASDPRLAPVYAEDAFTLRVNGTEYPLQSQILKNERLFLYFTPEDKIEIKMKKDMIRADSSWLENNALFIQLLSGDTVTYGDEGRKKQRHMMTHLIYKGVLDQHIEGDFYVVDISALLVMYAPYLSRENANNIFFTTSDLRAYHYVKQKENGYYSNFPLEKCCNSRWFLAQQVIF